MVAVNPGGVPIDDNCYIGNAFIRDDANGIIGNYGAEAFSKNTSGPAPVTNGSATLNFGTDYDAAPTQFSIQLQQLTAATTPGASPYTSDQTIVLASVSRDLGSTLSPTGQSGMGVIYNEDEAPASVTPGLSPACLYKAPVTDKNFRVVPGKLTNFLKGHYGYFKMNVSVPAVGILISKQGTAGGNPNKFSGIRTLHKTATGAATLTLPVLQPFCL